MDKLLPSRESVKCPVSKARHLSFGLVAKILGMINARPDLEKMWSTYDVDALYEEYISTGKKPFIQKPFERDFFLRYAYSKISIRITRSFLEEKVEIPESDILFLQLNRNNIEEQKYIHNTIDQSIRSIFQSLLRHLNSLEQDHSGGLIEEERLMQLINNDHNSLDPDLVQFATINGTLPTIYHIADNFLDILSKNGELNIQKYIEVSRKEKYLTWKAFSNIPAMFLYMYKGHRWKFLISKEEKTQQYIRDFMKNGFPIMKFNPDTLKQEFLYSEEDFRQARKIIQENHSFLRNQSYTWCPLLFEKYDQITMIHAVHVHIAKILFRDLSHMKIPPLA